LGLARVGRVVTAAALLMSISFAALSVSNVSIMRMFGVGLTLAVLTDATLVRMVLVPAFMHLLGTANWWTPKPLAALRRSVAAGVAARRAAKVRPRIGSAYGYSAGDGGYGQLRSPQV
jgi:putative drug exporter of the RND superfamily